MCDLKLEKGVVVLCCWDGRDPSDEDILVILEQQLGQVLEVSRGTCQISLRGQRLVEKKLVNDERICDAEKVVPVWMPPPGKRWPHFAETYKRCWEEILAATLRVLNRKCRTLSLLYGHAKLMAGK